MTRDTKIVIAGIAILYLFLLFSLKSRESKGNKYVTKDHVMTARGDDIKIETEPIKIEQINLRGDKKIHKIKGNIKFKKSYKKGDILPVEFDITPDVIKVVSSKHKLSLYAYPDKIHIGYQYEIAYLQDYKIFRNVPNYAINLGLSDVGLVFTVSKDISPHTSIFIGTSTYPDDRNSSTVVWGINSRL